MGTATIDLGGRDDGKICPQVHTILTTTQTRDNNIGEAEFPNCLILRKQNNDFYTGQIQEPKFETLDKSFKIINQNTVTVAQFGSGESIKFENLL